MIVNGGSKLVECLQSCKFALKLIYSRQNVWPYSQINVLESLLVGLRLLNISSVVGF